MNTSYLIFIFILILMVFYQGCDSEVSSVDSNYYEISSADDSNLPDSAKSLYLQDAARLSLRYLYSTKSPDTLLIDIPNDLKKRIYEGLIRIYNCKDLKYIEFITRIKEIHSFPGPDINDLIVIVDSSYEWTQAWRNNNIITGNSEIDKLLSAYSFKLKEYYSFLTNHMAVLNTNIDINISALARKISKVKGVISAGPEGYGGDGNDIELDIIGDKIINYTFSYDWGDCPSGCILRHYWEYMVYSNGIVQFVKEYGDKLKE